MEGLLERDLISRIVCPYCFGQFERFRGAALLENSSSRKFDVLFKPMIRMEMDERVEE